MITPREIAVGGGTVPAGETQECENGCPSWQSGASGW